MAASDNDHPSPSKLWSHLTSLCYLIPPNVFAVEAAVASAFKLSGQRCVSSGRMIVQRTIYDEFARRFAEEASKLKTGNPFKKPSWKEFEDDIIDVDKVAVRREVSQGSRYYNYKHKSKDGKKWFVEYLKKEKVDKDKIKHVNLVPDWRVGITYGALAKMLMDGCPPLE